MAKPILVIRAWIPDKTPSGLKTLRKSIDELLNHEYHIMLIFHKEDKEIQFEALNADKLPPITKKQFEELLLEAHESAITPPVSIP